MFAKFKLNLEDFQEEPKMSTYYQCGKELLSIMKGNIQNTLNSCITDDGTIDGSKLQENCFPQIEADIFISHSHKDEEAAIALTGWLYRHFGLTSFVDSYLWEYIDNLLSELNNKYNCKTHISTYTIYDHKSVLDTASHVHMMLSTALNQMMDHCESLFLLSSSNAIQVKHNTPTTYSPWIYFENDLANTIRLKTPERLQQKVPIHEGLEFAHVASPKFSYELKLKEFVNLNSSDLTNWADNSDRSGTSSLDWLYKHKEVICRNGN